MHSIDRLRKMSEAELHRYVLRHLQELMWLTACWEAMPAFDRQIKR